MSESTTYVFNHPKTVFVFYGKELTSGYETFVVFSTREKAEDYLDEIVAYMREEADKEYTPEEFEEAENNSTWTESRGYFRWDDVYEASVESAGFDV